MRRLPERALVMRDRGRIYVLDARDGRQAFVLYASGWWNRFQLWIYYRYLRIRYRTLRRAREIRHN